MSKKQWSKAMWLEWQRDPESAAQHWGIDWAEWQKATGRQDWSNATQQEFEEAMKKSRWAGFWDWTA